jgi:DNA (cytosine-5)-methyltransferase 1
VAELAVHVPPGGTWRDIPPHLLPDRFRSMRRTDGTTLYGRMTWDRPAYTMTTQFQNITTGCFIHPDETRPLTVREAARVQSFSDDFVFNGALSSKVMQIGNAVPPLLARALARQLTAILNGVPAHERRPLVVGPEKFRGEAVPGGAAAAEVMKSSGRHDDAAVEAMARHLEEHGHRVELRQPIEGLDVIPDIVLKGEKTALFVQGCFIYGCPQHNRNTRSQAIHWATDIARRKRRREAEVQALLDAGWIVEVAWEHEAPAAVVERLELALTA